MDLFDLAQEALDSVALVRKARRKRVMGRGKARRQRERLANRSAADLVERARRQPFDLVQNSQLCEDSVFDVPRIAGVGSLVQRGFDWQIADFVYRGRAAQAEIALQQADAVAGMRKQRARGQTAEARARASSRAMPPGCCRCSI